MAEGDNGGSAPNAGRPEPLGAEPAIVGIGASAGGIQALQTLFESLPENTGVAFVVIVHLAPEHHSELPRILAARTRMPVSQVNEAVPLEADHVYVTPPDRQLEIADNHIAAVEFEHPRARRAPIDLFFRSLAEQHGDGFAIILSGAGSDGSVGLKFVKEAGGIILVQDPDEAEYGSMPRSAIATGLADFIVPLRDMGQRLADLVRSKAHIAARLAQRNDQAFVQRILSLVRSRTGHDFSQYKKSTVLRRMQRRAQVTRQETFADYFKFLRENVEEVQALLGDLLISVTTFFRDPKAFEALAKDVMPRLFEDHKIDSPVRVWVPGCATGEEAYSIAMLLIEEASRHDLRPDIQVFASDLDVGALGVAREGRYPMAIAADVSDQRLRRFFSKEGDHYRVKHDLRESVLFASHSLLKDPPFGRLDLISCRNLLIYLDRELQQRACGIFHYALNADGFLFLGSSESAETPAHLFRVIDRDARIYRSTGRQAGSPFALPQLLSGGAQGRGPLPQAVRAPAAASAPGEGHYHRQSLEAAAPPSVLVDDLHRAINLSDTAGRYVQPPAGPLSNDISELVRPELRFDLRAALIRAFERRETTLSLPIMVGFNGERHLVYVQVKPLASDENTPPRHALVFFIEGGAIDEHIASAEGKSGDAGGPAKETIRQLREEPVLTQNRLKSVREGSETTTEELRAANEELQSINEEYRSTSEELETSKEELQSINEELQTVNAELKSKLESISRAHNDLQNLMAATDVGVLFLDTEFKINRFTPHIMELFNVTHADEGRPITDFTHQLTYDGLLGDVSAVLRDLTFLEREVVSRAGRWYLTRLRPYRTLDNKIDGVVVTFIDVTKRRAAEEALRQSEGRLRQMTQLVEMSREPVCVWEIDNGIIEWNRGSEALFGYSRDEALGQKRLSLLSADASGASFADLQHDLQETGSWNGEVRYVAKDGRQLTVETRIELFPFEGRRLVLETNHDITERKSWERRQQLLLSELTHRVKNTLAVVQSMAHQTRRGTSSLDAFMDCFDGRLEALASAHKLLVDSEWKGADLGALARNQLRPYAMDRPERIHLSGEPVLLPAYLATPFGLVLHELATNAAKHGALSLASGTIDVSWRLDATGAARTLTVEWREQGGPPVEIPVATSFGCRLIQGGLPDATVRHEFNPEGVVCTIILPMVAAEADEPIQ